jgi:SOS-response transcriptional repressor LexA
MSGESNHREIVVARRIKQLRQAKGLTQKAFADSLGIVQGYLSGIERGKKIPSYTLLMALCHIYKVDEEWLFGGGEPEYAENLRAKRLVSAAGRAKTPLLKTIPEGFPDAIGGEAIVDFISLPDVPDGCFAIVAEGDFMAPTIRDGDLVIFKPGDDATNRNIVLLTNKWGEPILRKYRIMGDEVYFSAENAAYAPFKANESTKIFGIIIDIWRKVKL